MIGCGTASVRAPPASGRPSVSSRRKAWCMASFEEEGSVVAVIGDLYGSLAAAYHGIRDDGLVGVHGDVLHRDLLLAFTAVTVERLAKPRERSGSLVGECQV